MANGLQSLLDRLERSYEELLKELEAVVVRLIRVLERYAVRIYQFFRHMFLKTLRLAWLLLTLAIYVLAPVWCWSFGDEMRLQGWDWAVKAIGWFLWVAGLGGLLVMGYGFVVYLVSLLRRDNGARSDSPERTKDRPAFFPVLAFDLVCILWVFIARYAIPNYSFASPLLSWLQALFNTWLDPRS